MMAFIQTYGIYGLFILACIPAPIRTVTLVTAIAGVGLFQIVIAILVGRLLSYILVSWVTSRFPNWLLRLPLIRRSPFLLEVLRTE